MSNEKEQQLDKTFLSTKEAAIFLDCSISQLYKLTSTRRIPFFKPNGKKIYFLKSDLIEHIRKFAVIPNYDLERVAAEYAYQSLLGNKQIKK